MVAYRRVPISGTVLRRQHPCGFRHLARNRKPHSLVNVGFDLFDILIFNLGDTLLYSLPDCVLLHVERLLKLLELLHLLVLCPLNTVEHLGLHLFELGYFLLFLITKFGELGDVLVKACGCFLLPAFVDLGRKTLVVLFCLSGKLVLQVFFFAFVCKHTVLHLLMLGLCNAF
jgi:hypothetical protein